jgi:STIP1 family protein 1
MPSPSEELHAHGNACFAKEKYAAAIEAYSECICLEPRPVYYINRANCYLKRHEFAGAAADCQSALGLLSAGQTKERIKAQYFLGKAQSELGDWSAGIAALATAHAMCQQETVSYAGDIRAALLGARKRAWEAGAAERATALHLIRDEMGSIGASLRLEQQRAVRALGAIAVDAAMEREGLPTQRVPEHLTCQICYDIMLDPVVTPCGISYDRACLQVGIGPPRTPVYSVRPLPSPLLPASIPRLPHTRARARTHTRGTPAPPAALALTLHAQACSWGNRALLPSHCTQSYVTQDLSHGRVALPVSAA